jgi:hypothetical protein
LNAEGAELQRLAEQRRRRADVGNAISLCGPPPLCGLCG